MHTQSAATPSYKLEAMPRNVLIAGILTSQVAALIMAVVMMAVFAVFLGKSPLYPVQVIGSTIYGEQALQGFQTNAFLAGLVLHLAVAFAWGLVFCVFAAVFGAETALKAGMMGVVVAILSMVDAYVFVPHVMLSRHGVDIWNREVPIFWDWAAHMVFGASFAFYPAVLRKWIGASK